MRVPHSRKRQKKASPWYRSFNWLFHSALALLIVHLYWDTIQAYARAIWSSFYSTEQQYGLAWFTRPCVLHSTLLLPGSCSTPLWIYLLVGVLLALGGVGSGWLYTRALNAAWNTFWAMLRKIVVEAVTQALRDVAQAECMVMRRRTLLIVVVVLLSPQATPRANATSQFRIVTLLPLVVVRVPLVWIQDLRVKGYLPDPAGKPKALIEGEVVASLSNEGNREIESPIGGVQQ